MRQKASNTSLISSWVFHMLVRVIRLLLTSFIATVRQRSIVKVELLLGATRDSKNITFSEIKRVSFMQELREIGRKLIHSSRNMKDQLRLLTHYQTSQSLVD